MTEEGSPVQRPFGLTCRTINTVVRGCTNRELTVSNKKYPGCGTGHRLGHGQLLLPPTPIMFDECKPFSKQYLSARLHQPF